MLRKQALFSTVFSPSLVRSPWGVDPGVLTRALVSSFGFFAFFVASLRIVGVFLQVRGVVGGNI